MIFIDLEVYSDVSITEVPLDVYANHKSTKIILACLSEDESPIEVYEADNLSRLVPRLGSSLLCAWNVGFERTLLRAAGFPTKLTRWTDTMVLARRLGLPGSLKMCCKVPQVGMPPSEAAKSETRLIKTFCMPTKKAGTSEEWEAFVEYCRRDVLALRHIHRYITSTFGEEEAKERAVWMLDQTINERGIPLDVPTVSFAVQEVNRLQDEARRKMVSLTGLENPGSVQQLHPWLKERCYPHESLGREFIQQALDRDRGLMTDEAIEVLGLRLSAAKSSVKKFAAMEAEVSPDGRARGRFVYYGGHTGRWSGRGFQPQNLNRTPHSQAVLNELIEGAL